MGRACTPKEFKSARPAWTAVVSIVQLESWCFAVSVTGVVSQTSCRFGNDIECDVGDSDMSHIGCRFPERRFLAYAARQQYHDATLRMPVSASPSRSSSRALTPPGDCAPTNGV